MTIGGWPSASTGGCQQALRLLQIVLVDHQADRDGEAHSLESHSHVEDEAVDAFLGQERLGGAGGEAVVEAGGLDQGYYQGTTSPASISGARGGLPRIALRCGKRPKRSMTSWCFLAKPS